jgi:hypothetical protein
MKSMNMNESTLIRSILAFGLIAFLAGSSAHAAGTQYVCKEITGGNKRTAVLTQDGNQRIREGVEVPFHLEILPSGESVPTLAVRGTVQTEDVMFTFKSQDESVTFGIYLDEMDQAYLSVRGKKDVRFDCN